MIGASLEKAKNFQRQGEPGKAGVLYDKILSVDANNLDALFFSSIVCIELGNYAKAAEHTKRAMKMLPNHPNLIQNLAKALMGLKRWDEAVSWLKELVRLKPDAYLNYRLLGIALTRLEQDLDAVREFQKALLFNPQDVESHKMISRILNPLHVYPLAIYHQRLAWYYGERIYDSTPDPAEKFSPQHTFFLDREKALRIARQGNHVTAHVQDSHLQMCYYLGEPFVDAPPTLINVPSDPEEFVPFFLSSKLSPPSIVDFDVGVEADRRAAGNIAMELFDWWQARVDKAVETQRLCKLVRPKFVPGQPIYSAERG